MKLGISEQSVPRDLGGKCSTCKECIPKGGIFGFNAETGNEVVVSAMSTHEHEVIVDKTNCVLAWHFQTESHNIGFAVLYEAQPGEVCFKQ